MIYNEVQTSRYKRDLKKIKHDKQLLKEIFDVVEMLKNDIPLDPKFEDHKLQDSKEFKDCRDCHIRPDWVLIYQKVENKLILKLLRTGNHNNILDSYQKIDESSNNKHIEHSLSEDEMKEIICSMITKYDASEEETFDELQSTVPTISKDTVHRLYQMCNKNIKSKDLEEEFNFYENI